MQPRSEPLLWLQCLALGAIPLELLLIRLVLAGADPGPVPGVERVLIWGVGVLAPAIALWRRPADWGSLLLVRQPLVSRSTDQLRISASQGGLSGRVSVVMAAVILLPVLWWLDDSAVLANEFSPVAGQSRLITLLLVSPLLALIVWQVQQLVQAATQLLGSAATVVLADSAFRADAVATQRTSLGLQLLNLPALDWPEPAEETTQASDQGADEAIAPQPSELETSDSTETLGTEDNSADNSPENVGPEAESSALNQATAEEPDDTEGETLAPINQEAIDNSSADDDTAAEAIAPDPSALETDDSPKTLVNEGPEEERSADNQAEYEASDDAEAEGAAPPAASSVAAAAPLPVEPEQPGEEQEGTSLDPEISEVDSVTGGRTEGHGEEAESSGREEGEPEQSSEPPPGRL